MPKEFDPTAMDTTAAQAVKELDAFLRSIEDTEQEKGAQWIINWINRWFLLAGYKRLGRALLEVHRRIP